MLMFLKNLYTMHGVVGFIPLIGFCVGGIMILVGLVKECQPLLVRVTDFFRKDTEGT